MIDLSRLPKKYIQFENVSAEVLEILVNGGTSDEQFFLEVSYQTLQTLVKIFGAEGELLHFSDFDALYSFGSAQHCLEATFDRYFLLFHKLKVL